MNATLLFAVVAVTAVLILAGLLVEAARWRRTPPELRGDWWARFEQAFWDYVAQEGRSHRGRSVPRRVDGAARIKPPRGIRPQRDQS